MAFEMPKGLTEEQQLDVLQTEILSIRDMVAPIGNDIIQKGRNVQPFAITPEYRNLTLKDARRIIKHALYRLNELADYFEKQ